MVFFIVVGKEPDTSATAVDLKISISASTLNLNLYTIGNGIVTFLLGEMEMTRATRRKNENTCMIYRQLSKLQCTI